MTYSCIWIWSIIKHDSIYWFHDIVTWSCFWTKDSPSGIWCVLSIFFGCNIKILHTYANWSMLPQVIEALDPNHQCLEYWNQKSRVKMENVNDMSSSNLRKYPFGLSCSPGETKAKLFGFDLTKQDPDNSSIGRGDHSVGEDIKTTLQGFFKKANREELIMMYKVFCSEYTSAEWGVAFTTLTEEIRKTCK